VEEALAAENLSDPEDFGFLEEVKRGGRLKKCRVSSDGRKAMKSIEWLNHLLERPERYRALLDEAGSFAAAAWRIAQARCRAREFSGEVPTRAELRAAAYELNRRVDAHPRLPTGQVLGAECEALGLLVI